jgi:hypothetical protein
VDRPAARRRLTLPRGAGGFVTVQFVASVALSLVLLVLLANVLVAGYARGVVRAALDEGVRAGARAEEATAECARRAAAVLDDLLGGPLRAGVEPVACSVDAERVRASTRAVVSAWLPGMRDWAFEVTATATRERLE